jgi:subtilisin family serine protease
MTPRFLALLLTFCTAAALAQGPATHVHPGVVMKTTTPSGHTVDPTRQWVNGEALVSISFPDEATHALTLTGPDEKRRRTALQLLVDEVLRGHEARGSSPGRWVTVDLPAGVTPDRADAYFRSRLQEAIARLPQSAIFGTPVLRTSPNYLIVAATVNTPNDPLYPQQWRYSLMQATEAWGTSAGSSSVYVAVLDTGIYSHPDLVANLDTTLGSNTYDPATPAAVTDVDGHGTFSAGIVGESGNNGIGGVGVNWSVRMIPVKMMEGNAPSPMSASNAALQYVLDLRKQGVNVRVVLAGWRNNPPSTAVAAQRDAIAALEAEGVVVVCAAGNERSDNDAAPVYPAGYGSGLNALPNVISVASSDHTDRLSYFSNWGAASVDLAAPGSDIYSTYLVPPYVTMSGTSAAAAHVAGAVALLLAAEPKLTPVQVKARIKSTVDVCTPFTGKVSSNGRLNLNSMLRGTANTPAHCAQ